MTDPRDLLVATAIEDKPDWLPHFAKEARAWRYRTQWDPCPFITAPTWELEGIVKTWLRTQGVSLQHKVALKLRHIWSERANIGNFGGRMGVRWTMVMLKYEEVGDWALALLEVVGD